MFHNIEELPAFEELGLTAERNYSFEFEPRTSNTSTRRNWRTTNIMNERTGTIEGLDVSERERQQICHENAAELFDM